MKNVCRNNHCDHEQQDEGQETRDGGQGTVFASRPTSLVPKLSHRNAEDTEGFTENGTKDKEQGTVFASRPTSLVPKLSHRNAEDTEGFTENGTTQITSKVIRRGTNGDPSFLRETNGWLWSPLFASLRNEASQRSKL
jgi:hypothetical protein